MERVDILVVGAGVVGLAVARALALAGRDVIVLDAANAIGTGASSRNSEVVHAGLYYTPGSLKATLCVRGRRLLYDYCDAHNIAVNRCGKLIVAVTDADITQLDMIAGRAEASGVTSLIRLSADEARAMEAEVRCAAALWSPETGIVDSHAFMSSLQHDAESQGAVVALRTAFGAAERDGDGWRVSTDGSGGIAVQARWIVNCAGLDAQRVARKLTDFPAAQIPGQYVAKGHYFALSGASPFTRLVYPTPSDGGLGVHLTLDLAGQARFGPDVEWIADIDAPPDYAVDATRAERFATQVRGYWPALPDDALRPAYAGLRTKLSGPGQPPADFRIDGPGRHGVAGVVHCFGIESPGLTASLAIAEMVTEIIAAKPH
jgi:L-2-hydroxyglutarate oxidase LhgO